MQWIETCLTERELVSKSDKKQKRETKVSSAHVSTVYKRGILYGKQKQVSAWQKYYGNGNITLSEVDAI